MFKFLDFNFLTDGEISLMISEKVPADFDSGHVPAYKYTILKDSLPAGKADIRIGSNENIYYGGNIGYEVFPQYRGNHYAAKACRLLRQVAAAHGMGSLYITCDPFNLPSRKTCENLGAKLLHIADLPENSELYIIGDRKKCIYLWEI